MGLGLGVVPSRLIAPWLGLGLGLGSRLIAPWLGLGLGSRLIAPWLGVGLGSRLGLGLPPTYLMTHPEDKARQLAS